MKIDDIKAKVDAILPELKNCRRHLHANPELSFNEKKTAEYIIGRLKESNVNFTKGWAGYGIVATIKSDYPDRPVVILRSDMDALPIQEREHPGQSCNPGIMHACGHDVHMTCLLGAVQVISQFRQHLKQDIVCIFQPGEEKLPGGAKLMLEEGAIHPDSARAIFALHVFPELEVGNTGFHSGPYMASTDELYIEITGKGGHAAMPHKTINPIVIASKIINDIQTVISQKKNPFFPSVLNIGKINSVGGATNVIPDKVLLEGTFRSLEESWRDEILDYLPGYIKQIAAMEGGSAVVNFVKGYPVLVNDEKVTSCAQLLAEEYLGKDQVYQLPPRMTAEDFAWYAQRIPACFFRLGTANEKAGITGQLHTAEFDVDETSIAIGCGVLTWIALHF